MTGKKIAAISLASFIFLASFTGVNAKEDIAGEHLQPLKIDEYIRAEMDAVNIPGLSIGIVKDDRILYLKGYGTLDSGKKVGASTVFGLGSVSKALTALAVRQLINQGTIDEFASVQKYLPEWEPEYNGQAEDVTINQLICYLNDGYYCGKDIPRGSGSSRPAASFYCSISSSAL